MSIYRIAGTIYKNVDNVGIGTTNPTLPLDVSGTIRGTNLTINDSILTSNLTVLGTQTIVNTYTTYTSNLRIDNQLGDGPALVVLQKGVGNQYAVADFYDRDVSTTIPALRVAEGGNVGIGTTLPQQNLHVQGNVYASGSIGIGTTNPTAPLYVNGNPIINGNIQFPSTNFGLQATAGDTSSFINVDFPNLSTAGGVVRMFRNTNTTADLALQIFKGDGSVNANTYLSARGNSYINLLAGNVGIGTASPNHKLHIYSTSTTNNDYESAGILLENATAGETAIAFRNSNVNAGGNVWFMGLNSNSSRFDIGYGTQSTQLADASVDMCIDTNGNVGIGTTIAQDKLYVYGNLCVAFATTIYRVQFSGDGSGSGPRLNFGNDTDPGAYLTIGAYGNVNIIDNKGTRQFTINNNGVETIRVNSSGNVGIGTTVPTHKLHIYSTSTTNNDYESAGILLENATAGETAIAFRNSNVNAGGNVWFMGLNSNSSRFDIGYGTQSTQLADASVDLSIDTQGNVGIGTTNPLQKLHLEGTGYMSTALGIGLTQPSYALDVAGYIRSSLGIRVGANEVIDSDGNFIMRSIQVLDGTGTTSLYVSEAGLVGIGTDTPQVGLDIQSTTVNISGNVGIGTTNPSAKVHLYKTDIGDIFRIDDEVNETTPFIVKDTGSVGIGSTNPLQQLHIQGNAYASGSVGIGSTQPVAPLDVSGNAFATSIGIGTRTALFPLHVQGTTYHSTSVGIGTNTLLQLLHVQGNAYASGSIGIGSTQPVAPLDVNGNIRGSGLTGTLITDNTSTTSSTIAASATAVKSAYDTAVARVLKAGDTMTGNLIVSASIGIGSTQPVAPLDVSGNAFATSIGIGTRTALFPLHVQGTTYHSTSVGIGSTNPLQQLHVQGNAYASGSIGIGSTQPIVPLDVLGTIRGTNLTINDSIITSNLTVLGTQTIVNTYTTYTSNLTIDNQLGEGPALVVLQKGVGNQYAVADFYDRDVSTTIPALRVAEGGNVGIGTTLPQQNLHVQGNVYASGSVGIGTTNPLQPLHVAGNMYVSTPNLNTVLTIAPGADFSSSTQSEIYMVRNNYYRGAGTRIYTTNSTESQWWIGARYTGRAVQIGYHSTQPEYSQNALMTVLTSGSIGIGTSEPTHKLHIYSTSTTNNDYESAGILLENATAGETAIAFRNSNVNAGGNVWFMGLNSNSSRFDIGYGTQSTQLADASVDLSIDTQGNVGIGTTNPLKKLDIIGDIRLTGSIYQNDNQALIYTGDGLRASADIAVRQVDPSYLEMNGQIVSQSTYPRLFNSIGHQPEFDYTINKINEGLYVQNITNLNGYNNQNVSHAVVSGNNMLVAVGTGSLIFRSSNDGLTWETIINGGTMGSGTQLNTVNYIGGTWNRWIIGGSGNNAQYISADNALTWTQVTSGNYNRYNFAFNPTTNKGIFVGSGGIIFSSTNATTWNQVTSGTTNTIRGVAYGYVNGTTHTWAAVGDSSTLLYSTNDATSFTVSTIGTGITFYQVSYISGNINRFVALGSAGNIYYSTNAINWSKSTLSPTNTSAAFVGLAVNDANDRLVAVGVPGTSAVCAYTTDLTLASWSTTSTSITGYSVDWNQASGAFYISGGSISGGSAPYIHYTYSNLNFGTFTTYTNVSRNKILRALSTTNTGAGIMIYTDAGGVIHYNPLTSTEIVRVEPGFNIRNAEYINGLYVVASSTNDATCFTSPDLISWTYRKMNTTATRAYASIRKLKLVNDFIIALTGSQYIFYSNNGITWNEGVWNSGFAQNDIVWTGTNYVVVGDGSYYTYSTNLTSWANRQQVLSASNYHINYLVSIGNGIVIAVGTSAVVYRSTDHGQTWTPIYLSIGPWTLIEVVYNSTTNTLVASTRENMTIVYSTDTGLTWNSVIDATFYGGLLASGIVFGNGLYVIYGRNSVIGISTDAISWDWTSPGGHFQFNDMDYGDGVFMGVGFINNSTTLATPGVAWSTDGRNWTMKAIPHANLDLVLTPKQYIRYVNSNWIIPSYATSRATCIWVAPYPYNKTTEFQIPTRYTGMGSSKLWINGDLTPSGNYTVSVLGNIKPANSNYTLGTPLQRWDYLYTNTINISQSNLGNYRWEITTTNTSNLNISYGTSLQNNSTITLLTSGSVGIGTTIAKKTLDIQGDLNFSGNLYQNNGLYISSQWTSNNTENSIYYMENVGIGTTDPTSKLDVIGNIHGTNLIIDNNILTSNLTVLGTQTIINTYTTYSSNLVIDNQTGTGPALVVLQKGVGQQYPIADFYDRDISTTVPVLRVADGGNIGIGTSFPNHKLHIYSTTITDNHYESAGILLENATAGEVGIAFRNTNVGTNAWVMGLNSNSTNLDISYGNQTTQLNISDVKLSLDTSGTLTTSNLIVLGQVALAPGALNTNIQIKPTRQTFYVSDPTQSSFTVLVDGLYNGEASNVQVYLGQKLLTYYSSTYKDYDVSLDYPTGTTTQYTITLTTAAVYGDFVDITVWPQLLPSSSYTGSVYQSINFSNLPTYITNNVTNNVYDNSFIQGTFGNIYTTSNVGIGTTSPLQPLHIQGNTYISGSIGIGTTNPRTKLDILGNQYISGNLGIGTTSLQYKLNVDGTVNINRTGGNSAQLYVQSLTGGYGSIRIEGTPLYSSPLPSYIEFYKPDDIMGSGLYFKDRITNKSWFTGYSYNENDPIATDAYQIGYVNSTSLDAASDTNALLTVKNTGSVGIGSTQPLTTLDVNGSIRATNLSINNTVLTSNLTVLGTQTIVNTYTSYTSNLTIDNQLGIGPALLVLQKGVGNQYPIADFYDRDVSTTIPALRVADGGNIGIGTTTPQQNLHIQGNAYTSGSIGIGTTQPVSALDMTGTALISSSIGIGTKTALFPLHVQGTTYHSTSVGIGTSTLLQLLHVQGNAYTSGSMGIGTATPLQPLHVEGNTYLSGSVGIGTTIIPTGKLAVTTGIYNLRLNPTALTSTSTITEYPFIIHADEGTTPGPAYSGLAFSTITGNITTQTPGATIQFRRAGAFGYGAMDFCTKDGTNALSDVLPRLTLVGSNIGIGNINPQRTLHVNGSVQLGATGQSLTILNCDNPIIIGGCLSDETTALTTNNSLKIYAPYSLNIRSTKLPKFTINTAATSTITFDITKNGTTIYSTKPTITSTNVTTSGGVLTTNPTTFAENDTIVASVNAAGTGGTGAKVYIYCT